jgi:hypothetical protein
MMGKTRGRKSALVLSVENVHTESCGLPPAIAKGQDDDRYVGYFENRYGEQWVVEIDREAKTGVLRGGDIGWDQRVELRNGGVLDILLSRDEQAWLVACWRAATGEALHMSPPGPDGEGN